MLLDSINDSIMKMIYRDCAFYKKRPTPFCSPSHRSLTRSGWGEWLAPTKPGFLMVI
jgi:hypothetical protein